MLTQEYSNATVNVYSCLSTDTKPVGCPNGSKLYELDTSTIYRYDKGSDTWHISQEAD